MSLEIKVPAVGESITEVILAKWVKNDGDHVEMDEVIAELESDKATFELTAEKAGTLKLVAKEGDTLEIGQLVCKIDEGEAGKAESEKPKAESATPVKQEKSSATGAETKETEIKVPTVGESITEVTLTKWLKQNGEHVALDEVIAELESDKATFELPAEVAGILNTVAKEGDTLEIGAIVATISGGGVKVESQESKVESSVPTQTEKSGTSYADKSPSPAAAKILAEKGIDAKDVKSTGVDGRITKEDAMNAQKVESQKLKVESSNVSKSTGSTSAPAIAGARDERREKMTSLRKTISKRLVTVKNETAMLTTFNEVNMAPIMELRKKYKDSFKEKHGVGLGFMSFFTKAVTEALKDFPAVGARIEGEEIVYSNFADVSIAVSAPKGLVVPVIRNAESMSMAEIEKEVVRLAVRARDGKLGIDEMTGGNFTITNGGIFGSMLSTPIINAPQSAILGMHNIVERPVAENGQVVIRPIMYVALSYDHRVIDGRESVGFLVKVKQLLEDPARLLLGI
nr:2-oxoglutarate dehydrogenase complex dihydrolipoyllysine-residue succinyltransferase [uncultured Pedobacter sp.]